MNSRRINRPAISWLFFLLTIFAVYLRADTHDDLVYQRYSRKVTPGKIPYDFDMKFTELARPATQEDVDKGKAVFTFQGLGPCRVWKLPKCPIFCEWPSLKDYPFEGQSINGKTNFDDFGNICQAEELQINGEWKRYFGFVCKHGVAVVPAREIYLSFEFEDCGCTNRTYWTELPGGTDWGTLGPPEQIKNGIVVTNALKPGDPIPVELFLRNRRGVASPVLGPVYRSASNGGPAFRQGILLSLGWAPFKEKNLDWNYPHIADFKPVSAIRTTRFAEQSSGPVLAPGQVEDLGVFDLRDWFNIAPLGYYQFHFEFDPASLGLPADERNSSAFYGGFTLGTPPERVTPEDLNKDIPAFGGSAEAERVRTLIKNALPETEASQNPTTNQLPELNHTPIPSDNGPPDEADIVGLWNANQDLLKTLNTNVSGRQTLEALMEKETSEPMNLLLASEAAPLGSRRAALFLFDCMTNTDYTIGENAYIAVRFAFYHYKQNPPDWLVEMAIAALSDERYATEMEKKGWGHGTFLTLSCLADEDGGLTGELGALHCTNAVPFLIEMTKKTNGRHGPVEALGDIGDPRAIPILIDLVKQTGPTIKPKIGYTPPDEFLSPVEALAGMRVREAVPILTDYMEYPEVIEALQSIGDPRALEPLQKLIAAHGAVARTGALNDPDSQQKRVIAARIAIANLSPDHRTEQLCELLTDPSFDEFQRRSVVWSLGHHPDPRAIPFLAKALKSDPSGSVVNQAITVLAVFKYKAAVDALIDSFDANYNGKNDWKRAYSPEMFRNNIADSLTQLTGQKIGADKQQWLNWWKQHRETTPDLK